MRIKNIVPSGLHEEFYKERLKQNGTHALIEEDVLSFEVFKRQNCSRDENELRRFLEASKLIKNHQDQLHTYRKMVKYPSFIEEILAFYDELCKADLRGDELNKSDELTQILVWLEEVFHQREKEHLFNEMISKQRFDSFHIVKIASDFFSKKQLEKMIQNGAQELKLKEVSAAKISFKKALNPRQECEAMLQDLLKRGVEMEEVLVVLADYENELPVLRQVAKRYRIPLEIRQLHEKSKVADFFCLGIDLWVKKDQGSLLEAIRKGFFEIENPGFLIEYSTLFTKIPSDFFNQFDHVAKILERDDLLDQREKDKLCYLEIKAEKARQEMSEMLRKLFEIETPLDLLVFLFEACKNKREAQDLAESKVLLEIKEDIEVCFMLIQDAQTLYDFQAMLKKKWKIARVSQKGLKVVPLAEAASSKKLAYVLSLQQENYPGFKALSGIFDESYVEKTKYPSLAERLEFHQGKVNWIFHCAEELVLSFCCSSYEGKSREAAYEIEQFAQEKPVFWELIQNEEVRKAENHGLSEQTSRKLFVREDGMIHGSISSFERHFLCPYSYFLQSGLNLVDETLLNVNAALIGTIQHAVLEELIARSGKKYAETSSEQVSELISQKFITLKKLFINQQEQLKCIEQRMTENLMTTLEFMKEMEQNTSFVCTEQEYRFEINLLEDSNAPIHIRGIIDRIDRCQDALRILDYKSSDKNLSKNKFLAGVQLQLLTYLVAAERIFHAKAAGAYYFSLKNSTVDAAAGKLNGRTFEYQELGQEELKESWIKEEGLKGWTFDDADLLDYDGRHISNLTMKEGKVVVRGGRYDFNQISSVLEKLYALLQKNLLSGKIACRPIEGACLFCKYKAICRFKGTEQKIVPLFEEELTISNQK